MDENVGGTMTKPLLDKLGGGRGNGRRGEHGHSEERVVRKSRLGPTPSLNKCAGQDTGHPLATATPPGGQFLSLKNARLRLDSFFLNGNYSTVYNENRYKESAQEIVALLPQSAFNRDAPRGPTPRDLRCFATVVCSVGHLVSNGVKQNHKPSRWRPADPCRVL